jgi:hypothetical protein
MTTNPIYRFGGEVRLLFVINANNLLPELYGLDDSRPLVNSLTSGNSRPWEDREY